MVDHANMHYVDVSDANARAFSRDFKPIFGKDAKILEEFQWDDEIWYKAVNTKNAGKKGTSHFDTKDISIVFEDDDGNDVSHGIRIRRNKDGSLKFSKLKEELTDSTWFGRGPTDGVGDFVDLTFDHLQIDKNLTTVTDPAEQATMLSWLLQINDTSAGGSGPALIKRVKSIIDYHLKHLSAADKFKFKSGLIHVMGANKYQAIMGETIGDDFYLANFDRVTKDIKLGANPSEAEMGRSIKNLTDIFTSHSEILKGGDLSEIKASYHKQVKALAKKFLDKDLDPKDMKEVLDFMDTAIRHDNSLSPSELKDFMALLKNKSSIAALSGYEILDLSATEQNQVISLLKEFTTKFNDERGIGSQEIDIDVSKAIFFKKKNNDGSTSIVIAETIPGQVGQKFTALDINLSDDKINVRLSKQAQFDNVEEFLKEFEDPDSNLITKFTAENSINPNLPDSRIEVLNTLLALSKIDEFSDVVNKLLSKFTLNDKLKVTKPEELTTLLEIASKLDKANSNDVQVNYIFNSLFQTENEALEAYGTAIDTVNAFLSDKTQLNYLKVLELIKNGALPTEIREDLGSLNLPANVSSFKSALNLKIIASNLKDQKKQLMMKHIYNWLEAAIAIDKAANNESLEDKASDTIKSGLNPLLEKYGFSEMTDREIKSFFELGSISDAKQRAVAYKNFFKFTVKTSK